MVHKSMNKQIKTPKRVVRYLQKQAQTKTDKPKTQQPETPAVLFNDWASI